VSGSDAAKKLQQKFSRLGSPPPATAAFGNLQRDDAVAPMKTSEPSIQLNIRVTPKLKKRLRLIAARDGISMSEVIVRSVALYEEKFGSAPEV